VQQPAVDTLTAAMNYMMQIMMVKFCFNDIPHFAFPEWFIEASGGEPELVVDEWEDTAPFYHVSPTDRKASILERGLVPADEATVLFQKASAGKDKGRPLVVGVYLEEDREFALQIAGIMYRAYGVARLTMFKVMLSGSLPFVCDPEGPPGAIVVLEAIPPDCISVEWHDIPSEVLDKAYERTVSAEY